MTESKRHKFLELAGTGATGALLLGAKERGSSASREVLASTSAALHETGNVDVYHVKDFGALDNSVHDDTSAIQSAIDTAWSERGGVICCPPGE